MRCLSILLLVFCTFFLFTVNFAHAVTNITINNLDGPGEGFNDTTAFTPVGGNPAVTIGQARLLAFRHAAFLWGSRLQSDVEIQIDAQFDPLPCNMTSAVLGMAGPNTIHRDYAGAPVASTWYVQALANAIAGVDLDPTSADAGATFNSDIDDSATCLGTSTWYFGLDGNPPAGQIDFVTVVVHELTHTLGFTTFMDRATGAKLLGYDDIYLTFLERVGATPSLFSDMSDAQRVVAAQADPDVVWNGPGVTAEAAVIPLTAGLNGTQARIHAPNPSEPGSSLSHFSDDLVPNELMEPAHTGVDHHPGLAVSLLEDIGWNLQPLFGTDVVFLMDLTGSTGSLIRGWLDQIPVIADAWQAFDPNVEFALATHFDYPFFPHGNSNEWAYRVETQFDPNDANLALAMQNLIDMTDPAIGTGGLDEPESQYEAIYQVLTGEGRELAAPINFTDPGEIPQVSLGQDSPMVIYHFTHPEVFHDRDTEPNYPYTGAVDSRADKSIPGRTAVMNRIAEQSALNMFIGLTFITGATSAHIPAEMTRNGELSALAELSNLSGGNVYNVGTELEFLQEAIDDSIDTFETSTQNGDDDGDGILPPDDNCPEIPNQNQLDYDGDGVGDACDNCIGIANENQTDLDLNGRGDVCNCLPGTDADGDRICDGSDLCPGFTQTDITQLDTDEDGIPNECECGDFDKNGQVNTLDARLIQRCAIGQIPCTSLCDANGDGNCNTADARLVQRHAVGQLSKWDLMCEARP